MDMNSPEHLLRAIDSDAQETAEWIEALTSVIATAGPERARFLLSQLASSARAAGLNWRDARITPYINTIRPQDEPPYPGGADAIAIE
jgi:pyruvate dehydrogenase E1 component